MSQELFRQRNLLVLALNVVGAALFLACGLSVFAASWPAQYGLTASDLILRGRPFFPQEYDTLIFRSTLIAAAMLTLSAYMLFRKHLNDAAVAVLLQRALAAQTIGLVLMGSAIYLMVIYPAISAFAWALKAVMAVTLLYMLTVRWHGAWFANWAGRLSGRLGVVLKHAVVLAVVLAVVWVNPKSLAAAARGYGISLDAGTVFYVQVLVVAYLMCMYALLLHAGSSIFLSCLGLCWAMKWLLFHPGINASFHLSPVLINLAHGAGVLFFLLLWHDRHRGGSCWLVLALMVATVSYKVYMPVGVFLSTSLVVYLFLQCQHQWRWPLVTVIAAGGAYVTLSLTPLVAFEGFAPVPFYAVLRERLFYIYAGSVLLLVFYLIVVLAVFRQVRHERKVGLAWPGALTCYGLLLVCNYVRLVEPFHFYAALWPLLVLILPVVHQRMVGLKSRALILTVMAVLTAAFLFGNPWFLWSMPFKGLGGG